MKLYMSRITPHSLSNNAVQPFHKIFLRSQFVLPILLSVVFVIFLISACVENYMKRDSDVQLINFISFLLFNGMIVLDMCVYLFLEPQVRKLLSKRWRNWRARRMLAEETERSRESNVRVSSVEMHEIVKPREEEHEHINSLSGQ